MSANLSRDPQQRPDNGTLQGSLGRPGVSMPALGQVIPQTQTACKGSRPHHTQRADTFRNGISRRQEQHRRRFSRSRTAKQRQAIGARQPPVENNQIPAGSSDCILPVVTVRRALNNIISRQALNDELGDFCPLLSTRRNRKGMSKIFQEVRKSDSSSLHSKSAERQSRMRER